MTDQPEEKPISLSELEEALPNVPSTSTSTQVHPPFAQQLLYQQGPSVYPVAQYTQTHQGGQSPPTYPSTSTENPQYCSYSLGQQSVAPSQLGYQYGPQMGYHQNLGPSPVVIPQYGSPISGGPIPQASPIYNVPQYHYQPQQQLPQHIGSATSMPGYPASASPHPTNQPYMAPTSPMSGTSQALQASYSPGVLSDEYSGLSADPDFALPRGPPRKPKQSGFALWVGNLPRDVALEELKEFFALDGLESIFLIRKSNCAFVNYKTEEACSLALSTFNDKTFKNVRLVCRLRKISPLRTPTVPPAAGTSSPMIMAPTEPQAAAPNIVPFTHKLVDKGSSTEDSAPGLPTERNSVNRYFIMKSLTKEDLAWSVANKAWATQPHNESILNEAWTTSDNVYLVFSVNKSGEFYGYARMASEIYPQKCEAADTIGSEHLAQPPPVVLTGPKTTVTPRTSSAPRGKIFEDEFRGTVFWEIAESSDDDDAGDAEQVRGQYRWGNTFRVEWLRWDVSVPFQRTRLLRNPWNGNKEVKISRDGTELEPSIGARLLREFDIDPPTTTEGNPGSGVGSRRMSSTEQYRQPAPSIQVMYPSQTSSQIAALGIPYYPYNVPPPQATMYSYSQQSNVSGPPQSFRVPPQGGPQYQSYGQPPPRQ